MTELQRLQHATISTAPPAASAPTNFLQDFVAVWAKLMNQGRYDLPQ